jgi:metal-dependent amidase/aminoacylase/carboxypeptidase family protein
VSQSFRGRSTWWQGETEENTKMNWSASVDSDLEQQMRGWRRYLHARPELGFEEHETTKYLVQLLNGWHTPTNSRL